jgi:hypothetical protein
MTKSCAYCGGERVYGNCPKRPFRAGHAEKRQPNWKPAELSRAKVIKLRARPTLRAVRAPVQVGQSVTWSEDGRDFAGQVWDLCPDYRRCRETATHGAGHLWWVVVASPEFPGELRVASESAGEFTVGYWQWTPAGNLVREGKSSEFASSWQEAA